MSFVVYSDEASAVWVYDCELPDDVVGVILGMTVVDEYRVPILSFLPLLYLTVCIDIVQNQ